MQEQLAEMTNPVTELKEAVIVDVDGTLCDVSGIRHYLLNDPKRRNFVMQCTQREEPHRQLAVGLLS